MPLRLRRQVAVLGVPHKDGSWHDDEVLQIPITTDRDNIDPKHLAQIDPDDFVDVD